jgi:hypothetical protein
MNTESFSWSHLNYNTSNLTHWPKVKKEPKQETRVCKGIICRSEISHDITTMYHAQSKAKNYYCKKCASMYNGQLKLEKWEKPDEN